MSVCGQRTLSRQEDALSSVQLDLQQVSCGMGSGLDELRRFKTSLDGVMQELLAAETLREHIGNQTGNSSRHLYRELLYYETLEVQLRC